MGSSLGVLLPLSQRLGFMPEVSVLVPFGTDRFELYERLSPRMGGTRGVLFQLGLGVLFGGLDTPGAQSAPELEKSSSYRQ